jgi:hypothetical protein
MMDHEAAQDAMLITGGFGMGLCAARGQAYPTEAQGRSSGRTS